MDSNLKVGSNNAGLFIGNTEILGGGVANLLKYITIAPDFDAKKYNEHINRQS